MSEADKGAIHNTENILTEKNTIKNTFFHLKDNFLNLLNFLSDFLLTTLLSFGLISSLANISKQHSSINRKLVGSDGVQPGEEVPI